MSTIVVIKLSVTSRKYFLVFNTTICEDFYPLNGRRRRTLPYPYTIYICIVGPTVHDSRWHNIEPSHDKTWLCCVRRITTQISLRICTVYSNKRFFVSCFDSCACNNGSYVKKLRYVSSSCVQMQFTPAWRGPFLCPWMYIGQTEVVLISKDQKDRTVCVRLLCVINRNQWI